MAKKAVAEGNVFRKGKYHQPIQTCPAGWLLTGGRDSNSSQGLLFSSEAEVPLGLQGFSRGPSWGPVLPLSSDSSPSDSPAWSRSSKGQQEGSPPQ